MKGIRFLLVSICVAVGVFSVPALGFGQVAPEPSYEVSLQILAGSNDAVSKRNVPANLSAVTQRLKTGFGYSNYRLAGTILARMTNQSSFEYKSVTNLLAADNDAKGPTFLELTISGLKQGAIENGLQGFQIQSFRFGARVPIITSVRKDEAGRDQPIVNYEHIGLTSVKIGLRENIPTLIGTLDLPGSDEMFFILITVKPADL